MINHARTILLLLIGCFCLLPVTHAAAQVDRFTEIDDFVQERMASLNIPGVALAVVQGEEIVHLQGYGVANQAGDPVTPQTPFLLASFSKSMTAVAVMQLVEAGQVEIDAPIQQYLPWFQPNMPMTVRQLLNQTSGLDEGQGYERNLDPDGEDALEQSIRQLATTALNNQPPGTAFEYSNSNYDVLGLLVESVSGQPYGTYMQDNLFEPLSMTHSFTSLEAARMAGMSSAFYPLFGWQTNVDGILPYSRSTQPSAGLIGSVEDMAHYLIAHLNNGRFQNNQLLSPASIETLHSPAVTIGSDAGAVDYAMGWVAWLFEDAVQDKTAVPPTALSHGGAWLGFQHIMLLIPEKELGMVLLLNSNDPSQSSAYSNIAFDVTLLALGLDAQNYPPQEDMLTRYLRPLSLTVILLLLIGGWVALRRLRGHVLTIRDRWFFMGLTMIDLGLIVYLLGIRLPNNNSSVPLVLRFEPDLGVMLVIVLLLTAVWGSIRTLYVLHRWWGQARAGIR